VDAITDDHLFPRSWYPETTPQNLEKWKFPACGPCNKNYGRIEEDLRLRLAACVDPKSEAATGLWARALDSITPERGRSPLDVHKRKLARNRFLKTLREAQPELMDHILPEVHENRPVGKIALLVSGRHIYRFVTKLVRGTVYLTEKRYIEANQDITVSLLKRPDDAEMLQLLERFGELYERGPGIRIRKAAAEDGRTNALFVFDIWDQFRFYGAVMDAE
jgi:hypothetical protein